MIRIHRFNEELENNLNIIDTIYDDVWENDLPDFMIICYDRKLYKFRKGNIMKHSDMLQITYDSVPGDVTKSTEPGEIWGASDTLEFDLYFAKDDYNKNIAITVSISYGDFIVSEFILEQPNNINVIIYTSYNSKFNPNGASFGIDDDSLQSFINFLDRFRGMRLSMDDFKFLDKYDNYDPDLFPKTAGEMYDINKSSTGYPINNK